MHKILFLFFVNKYFLESENLYDIINKSLKIKQIRQVGTSIGNMFS
jgi:hypothetical protein